VVGPHRSEIEEQWPGYSQPIGDKHSSLRHLRRRELRLPVGARRLASSGVPAPRCDPAPWLTVVLAVTHGGRSTVEHLDGRDVLARRRRWLTVDGDRWRLGDRILLVEESATTARNRSSRRFRSASACVHDAELRCGLQGPKAALVGDRLTARLARPVGALVEAAQRVVDVGELGLDLLEDREVLLALERLGGDIGRVLRKMRQLRGALVL
jgi:hypothetical protein